MPRDAKVGRVEHVLPRAASPHLLAPRLDERPRHVVGVHVALVDDLGADQLL